jgi:hypothetical protein
MRSAAWACVFLILSTQEQKRLPVPEGEAQRQAEKLIRDVFKGEFDKKAPADRLALAKKLFEQSETSKEDPTSRFVLLTQSRDLAAQAGDSATAIRAIDALGRSYEVDAGAMKLAIYASLAKNVKTPEEMVILAKAHLTVVDEALFADKFDLAERANEGAQGLAKRAKQPSLVSRTEAKGREVADRRTKFDKVRKNRELLAATPDNGAANTIVGQYECLTKGNWPEGLPFLARGTDGPLRALALQDLVNPSEPQARLLLGDGWWDMAEKEAGATKLVLRARARHWYEAAFPALAGLPKIKVEKRLSELRFDVFRGTWMDLTNASLFGLPGKSGEAFEFAARAERKTIFLQRFPEGDFDGFSARMRWDANVYALFLFEGNNRMVQVEPSAGRLTVLHLVNNAWTQTFTGSCERQESYVITALLSDGEYQLFIDGREFARERTSLTRLLKVGFQAEGGAVTLDQVRLRRKE